MTSPFELHQFLLNSEDELTPTLLRFFTFLDHETIEDLDDAVHREPQLRRAQRVLARSVVEMVHGVDAATRAERASEALFSESIADVDEATLLEIVADSPSTQMSRETLRGGMDPVDALVATQLASSKGEARRFLEQGGVYVNNRRLGADQRVDLSMALHDRYLVLRRGRRQLHLVVVV